MKIRYLRDFWQVQTTKHLSAGVILDEVPLTLNSESIILHPSRVEHVSG